MYTDVALNDHTDSWVTFLIQLAQHRYGAVPQRIIGISSNTATIHDESKVVAKLPLRVPLASNMPVDTIPLPTLMIQTGIDQPICLIYNDAQLTAMMN